MLANLYENNDTTLRKKLQDIYIMHAMRLKLIFQAIIIGCKTVFGFPKQIRNAKTFKYLKKALSKDLLTRL